MATMDICKYNAQVVYSADEFARRDHPVRFSNELVDSLQKNTFVSCLAIVLQKMMNWG